MNTPGYSSALVKGKTMKNKREKTQPVQETTDQVYPLLELWLVAGRLEDISLRLYHLYLSSMTTDDEFRALWDRQEELRQLSLHAKNQLRAMGYAPVPDHLKESFQ